MQALIPASAQYVLRQAQDEEIWSCIGIDCITNTLMLSLSKHPVTAVQLSPSTNFLQIVMARKLVLAKAGMRAMTVFF
jgi:hypothetical protein